MKIISATEAPQGSERWLQLRAGIPTASRFSDILTKSGKPSASAERLLYTLLAERCLGAPIIEHVSWYMERGSQMEQEAIRYYELQSNSDTEPVGFVTNDAQTIGASPDRFVSSDGLLEVKCPAAWQHMSFLLNSGTVYDYCKIQALGQLWITERAWVDIMSYCPGLPPAIFRVERDEPFIEKLAAAVMAFS